MKKLLFQFTFFLFVITFVVAQEKLDIVYLKNGNILKGVIVENVPNDHVRIELPGGSLITIKYLDIKKFLKESTSVQKNEQSNQTSFTTQQFLNDNQTQRTDRLRDFPQFKQGVYQLSGDITYFNSNWENRTYKSKQMGFSANPWFSIFVIDGLSIGIGANYHSYNVEWTDSNNPFGEKGSDKSSSYGVGLSFQYYAIGMLPTPFFGGVLGYSQENRDSEQRYVDYLVDTGLSIPILLQIGLEPFIQYSILNGDGDFQKEKNTRLTIGIRVAYYIFE